MMGERRVRQEALFYEFSLERHVPERHLLRAIDRFVELDAIRVHLAPFYSETGRPSIDLELLIRMLSGRKDPPALPRRQQDAARRRLRHRSATSDKIDRVRSKSCHSLPAKPIFSSGTSR
jgi:hypothetical protein